MRLKGSTDISQTEKPARVTDELLKKSAELGSNAVNWPWLSDAEMLDKRRANKFMLGAIVD